MSRADPCSVSIMIQFINETGDGCIAQ